MVERKKHTTPDAPAGREPGSTAAAHRSRHGQSRRFPSILRHARQHPRPRRLHHRAAPAVRRHAGGGHPRPLGRRAGGAAADAGPAADPARLPVAARGLPAGGRRQAHASPADAADRRRRRGRADPDRGRGGGLALRPGPAAGDRRDPAAPAARPADPEPAGGDPRRPGGVARRRAGPAARPGPDRAARLRRAGRARPRRARRALAGDADLPAHPHRQLAGDPRRGGRDRPGRAAQPADRGAGRRVARRPARRPGDRRRVDRQHPGDGGPAGGGRRPAPGRGGAAGARPGARSGWLGGGR